MEHRAGQWGGGDLQKGGVKYLSGDEQEKMDEDVKKCL
jgi:hypothetical protein